MRRLLLALAISVPGWLLGSLAASAANTPGQIVNCAGTPPWCFSPKPIQVRAGSTVSWTNATAPTHTATSDTGAWDTGNIAPGATSTGISFPTAGTFSYHCAIHPSMTGSVIVSAVAASGPPVRALAPGGGGPTLPAGAVLLLLGLVLLAARRVRRDRTQRQRRFFPARTVRAGAGGNADQPQHLSTLRRREPGRASDLEASVADPPA